MAHTKNCENCGQAFTGNINRRFCTDACRKYYSRHGGVGHSGLRTAAESLADKSGQRRTSPRSPLTTYAGKKAIDLVEKLAVQHLLPAVPPIASTNHSASTALLAHTPLLTALPTSTTAGPETGATPRRYRPALSPALRALLGDLSYPFQLLVWGLPGSGKSTLSLLLADALAERFKVLYISGEESLQSATLQQKQARTLTRPATQFAFANRLPTSAAEWRQVLFPPTTDAVVAPPVPGGLIAGSGEYPAYRTVVYDSITMLGVAPFFVKATANECRFPAFREAMSHIFISHAHKDGKEYRGDGSWGHEVDIIIRCHEGEATIEKNRFATEAAGRIGSTLRMY